MTRAAPADVVASGKFYAEKLGFGPPSLFGEPPAFYVSKAYRSRAVREPRQVLREFGVDIPERVDIASFFLPRKSATNCTS